MLSFQGDVPRVKTPCDVETTSWKVQKRGREIMADWFLIQRSLTVSKEFAYMIRYLVVSARRVDTRRTMLTRFPKRTWNTSPYCFASLAALRA
jgi:hypothetical protein